MKKEQWRRLGLKRRLKPRHAGGKRAQHMLVATTEKAARNMMRTISKAASRNKPSLCLAILDKRMTGECIEQVQVTADRQDIVEYVKTHVVDEVLINVPEQPQWTAALAQQLLDMGVTVHICMEDAYQQFPNQRLGNVFGYQVLTTSICGITRGRAIAKRLIDVAGGIVGCLITAMLTVFIGPAIYRASPGPIFFSQIRVGKNGRTFKMYKFRSMYMDAEKRKRELESQNKFQSGLMFKMDNDPRIIKGIGQWIRKANLDEFPQFWNVLKGDMSIVGTRPPLLDEYQQYSPHHKRRLAMAPGITGLWQVSRRSSITDFEEVVRLDTAYIENWSMTLDFRIILKTVLKPLNSGDRL